MFDSWALLVTEQADVVSVRWQNSYPRYFGSVCNGQKWRGYCIMSETLVACVIFCQLNIYNLMSYLLFLWFFPSFLVLSSLFNMLCLWHCYSLLHFEFSLLDSNLCFRFKVYHCLYSLSFCGLGSIFSWERGSTALIMSLLERQNQLSTQHTRRGCDWSFSFAPNHKNCKIILT